MNKNSTNIHGLATTAAVIRASIKSGISIEKAFGYMKLIFNTLDITGQNSFEKFLEEMQEEDRIAQLAEATEAYCDFDGLIQFLTVMYDTNDSIAVNKVKAQDFATKKKLCKSNPKSIELKHLLKEMFGEIDPKAVIESDHDADLASDRLKILGCEIKGMNLPDMQLVHYINIPKKPFSELKKDFDTATHFKVLSDIADKFNEAEEKRIMFVVKNQQTGLLACSYFSALLDKEKYSNCEEDDDEQDVDFSEKVLMINASEVRSEDQRSAFRNLSFHNGGLNMQAIGGIGLSLLNWTYNYVSLLPFSQNSSIFRYVYCLFPECP